MTRLFRRFKFDIYDNNKEAVPSQKELAATVAAFIKTMQKLDRLAFAVPQHHIEIFEQEFMKANVTLPKVKTLIVGPFCQFAVKMCPNVKSVATSGFNWVHIPGSTGNLLKSLEATVNLTRLEILDAWTVPILKGKLTAKLLLVV